MHDHHLEVSTHTEHEWLAQVRVSTPTEDARPIEVRVSTVMEHIWSSLGGVHCDQPCVAITWKCPLTHSMSGFAQVGVSTLTEHTRPIQVTVH